MLKFSLIRLGTFREMGVFTQNWNSLTGKMTWEAKDEQYDYHQEIARSGFADMLHDHERNAKYDLALARAIKEKHSRGEEANVLDIGTGTGLLSMMAAKHKADSIVACEAFTPMAECALKIIEENGFKNMIKLVQKRSTQMKVGQNEDMKKKANILVTEIFDTELIGEGALSTFRHACQELLEPDSIVIPSSGTIWVQIVESSLIDSWNRLKPICDTNGRTLLNVPTEIQSCTGVAAVHDIQLSQLPPNSFKLLTTPQPLFRFDFSGQTPIIFDEKVTLKIQPCSSGKAHAVFMWWDLDMGWNDILSCAPIWAHPLRNKITKDSKSPFSKEELIHQIPWRDHWMQAIYYFPQEIIIEKGKNANLIGHHDEYSFWFQLKTDKTCDNFDYPSPVCHCGLHVAYSRTRIGQLNDVERNNKYIRALRKKITPTTVCLCLSDGCLFGLVAAKLGAKKVYVLELNFLSRRNMEMVINENELSNKVEIIDSLDNLPPSKEINLIFGEPFFIGSIVPWENLRFSYIISKYNEVERIPISATIRAIPMRFDDLQTIRALIGSTLGFDLSSFDNLVQASSDKTDNLVEAQPLWEYPGIPLSLPFDIVKFDLTDNIENQKRIELSDTVPIEVEGLYNGVALWVDWRLDEDIVVSCGPTQEIQLGTKVSWDPFTRQGVHLIKKETKVTKKHALTWSFSFTPEHGDMEFHFDLVNQ